MEVVFKCSYSGPSLHPIFLGVGLHLGHLCTCLVWCLCCPCAARPSPSPGRRAKLEAAHDRAALRGNTAV